MKKKGSIEFLFLLIGFLLIILSEHFEYLQGAKTIYLLSFFVLISIKVLHRFSVSIKTKNKKND